MYLFVWAQVCLDDCDQVNIKEQQNKRINDMSCKWQTDPGWKVNNIFSAPYRPPLDLPVPPWSAWPFSPPHLFIYYCFVAFLMAHLSRKLAGILTLWHYCLRNGDHWSPIADYWLLIIDCRLSIMGRQMWRRPSLCRTTSLNNFCYYFLFYFFLASGRKARWPTTLLVYFLWPSLMAKP